MRLVVLTLSFIILTFAQSAFAKNIQLYFINNTPVEDNIVIPDWNDFNVGPEMSSFGGTAEWNYPIINKRVTIGLGKKLVGGTVIHYLCRLDTQHTLVLNYEKYKPGEKIIITLDTIKNNVLFCTCMGSACDLSTRDSPFPD